MFDCAKVAHRNSLEEFVFEMYDRDCSCLLLIRQSCFTLLLEKRLLHNVRKVVPSVIFA
jgi:hypothetical protein